VGGETFGDEDLDAVDDEGKGRRRKRGTARQSGPQHEIMEQMLGRRVLHPWREDARNLRITYAARLHQAGFPTSSMMK